MSRNKREYTTRDPNPQSRDPILKAATDSAVSAINHPPIIRVPVITCKGCGGSTWLSGGTTVPNATTHEMLRWRSCAKCRMTHYFARPMTEQEIDRYCAPEKVGKW